MEVSLDQARGIIAAIQRDLGDDQRTAQEFAELAADAARARAAGRPTPQAPGVGRTVRAFQGAIVAQGAAMLSGRAVPISAVGWGAEFGSSLFRQFGPRALRGHWLYPAANDPKLAERLEDTYVAELIDRRIP